MCFSSCAWLSLSKLIIGQRLPNQIKFLKLICNQKLNLCWKCATCNLITLYRQDLLFLLFWNLTIFRKKNLMLKSTDIKKMHLQIYLSLLGAVGNASFASLDGNN